METKLVKINNMEDCKKDMEEAGRLIKEGELVAFPTETVYGLGGNGVFPDAARKIYAAKGRPSDNPLILHVCDMQMVEFLVKEIPDNARRAMEHFWPGPMTVILPKADQLLLPAAPVRSVRTAGRRSPSGRPRPRRCEDEPAAQFLRRVRGLHRRRTGRHDRQQPPAAALHRAGRQGLRPGDTGHVHGTQKPRTAAGRQRPVQYI